jgi:response regulator RpfG family c-di-GMP phosphodiesterase
MADLDDVMRAITEVDTSRFLPKPWNDSLLLATIAEALTFRSLQLESRGRQP